MADPQEATPHQEGGEPTRLSGTRLPPVISPEHPLQRILHGARNRSVARFYFVPGENGPVLDAARTINETAVREVERAWIDAALDITRALSGPLPDGPFLFHLRTCARELGVTARPARTQQDLDAEAEARWRASAGLAPEEVPPPAGKRLCFVDFEASGLAKGSWPIEVGACVLDTATGDLRTWSAIIRTDPGWDPELWSAESEAVHGISRVQIAREGRPAAEIARRLAEEMGAADACLSDAPAYDAAWLLRLLEAGGERGRPELISFEEAVNRDLLTIEQYHALDPDADGPAPHRAGPDAERMARVTLRALRGSDLAGPEAF